MQVVWDVPENASKVQARLDFAFVGCKCKTGCQTRRCKCVKQDHVCGPACQHITCKNLQKQSAPDETSPVDDLERDELELETDTTRVVDSDDDGNDELNKDTEDIDDIMDCVFGSDSETEM